MRWLEQLILSVAPGWAAKRAAGRYVTRQFDGADLNRLRARASYASYGPRMETQANRAALLNVARELDRNNSFAHGAFNTLSDNIVGRGIQLEARVAYRNGRLRERINRDIEREWLRWARRADIHRQLSYWEIQRLVDRELWLAGEVLIVRTEERLGKDDRGRAVPLALEIVESERLADTSTGTEENGNEVVQGVEYNADGRIVAYHIYPKHPADAQKANDAQRVPANRVIHLFRAIRPNQVRGYSRVASVARNFEALGQYMDHELTRARVAASFAVMIKRGGMFSVAPKFPSAGSTAETTDENLNPIAHLEGGMIFAGGPNDSIEGTGPSIQTTAFAEFVTVNLRAIAVGMNMSYELLARDYTKTNFSSARQSDLQDRRHWIPRQQYLNDRLNDQVFAWFAGSAYLQGIQPFDKFFAFDGGSSGLDDIDHAWITPPREYVDPTKEQDADERSIAAGFTNIAKIAAKHGTDVHENLRINAQIAEEARELGVPLSPFAGATTAPTAQEPEVEEDSDAEDEDQEDTQDRKRRKVWAR